MKHKRLHTTLGLIMLAPLLGWAITGAVFLIKPGYTAAYQQLQVKTYPLLQPLEVHPGAQWHEVRFVRSALGQHLLVSGQQGSMQLDVQTLQRRHAPPASELEKLVDDAIAIDRTRYGNIAAYTDGVFVTDTGVEITVNWQQLTLGQSGGDTRLINKLYDIHYLRWFNQPLLDRTWPVLGLLMLIALMTMGLISYSKNRRH